MYNTKAYSAASATSLLASTKTKRRDPTEHDMQIEILFCGICHSDLHAVRNEWSSIMPTVYPIVLGHEIVGCVTKVGSGGPPSRSRHACQRRDRRRCLSSGGGGLRLAGNGSR
jgi:D-arabinose 1-dehydrogenase-like Zn-dependent alcohol dehydrogenase